MRNSIVVAILAPPRISINRIDKQPVPVKATDCPPQIVITVTPDQRPGRYKAYIETEPNPLCVSRQPFLDGARKLLARGHDLMKDIARCQDDLRCRLPHEKHTRHQGEALGHLAVPLC